MNRTELKERIEMYDRELTRLRRIKTNCHSCMYFGSGGMCDRWGAQVPPEVQPEGCDDWIEDEIPF